MKQIIAMGGGGFSMEPDNPLLDEYVLNSVKKEKPRICFLPTASGDSESYIIRFYDFFQKQNCHPSHLSLFKPEGKDVHDLLLKQDIIYVGGGSTKNMLAVWKEWKVDQTLKTAYEKGILLAGISAGAICWFEEGLTDSFGPRLEPLSCLGFLSGSCCPHYDGEKERRPAYHTCLNDRSILPGYAMDDGAALHFTEGELEKAVCSRPNAKAYQVSANHENVLEQEIEISYLY